MSTTVVDWQQVIREVVAERMALADDRGIDLDASEMSSAQVFDEGGALTRSLGNAIDNALRHTSSGGRSNIHLTKDHGMSCLVVEDTGTGISEADLDRVFEPFHRGDPLQNADGGGDFGLWPEHLSGNSCSPRWPAFAVESRERWLAILLSTRCHFVIKCR